MVLQQAEQLVEALRTIGRSRSTSDSRTAETLSVCKRCHVATTRVVQVRPPAGHPGAEVRPDRAEHDHDAARHVLAAVRADALDHRRRAAVANREAHPGPPDEVQPTAVAPYSTVLPAIASPAAATGRSGSGRTTIRPPDSPLPT